MKSTLSFVLAIFILSSPAFGYGWLYQTTSTGTYEIDPATGSGTIEIDPATGAWRYLNGFYPDSADTFSKAHNEPKECPCRSASVTALSTSGN